MSDTFPMDPSTLENMINKGIIYGYKRDKGSRPIIIVNVERMVNSGVI